MKRGIAPKRRFSQNFLTDQRTAQKIVAALENKDGDHVLEIGPGTGALTKWLVGSTASSIIAADLDERAIQHLQAEPWVDATKVTFILRDVLSINTEELFSGISAKHRTVIGNIPYAITSEILFWLFEQRSHLRAAVIMMQREVARRCVAEPGTKDYGILTLATWYASEAKLLFNVQPGSFFPRPEVTSSVVRFEFRTTPPLDIEFQVFMGFVRAAFSQRRKVMSNSLSAWWSGPIDELRAEVSGFDLTKTRAEQLTPQQLGSICITLLERKGASRS